MRENDENPPEGRALSRPKFRDDTAVVPPKYGRNWSQTSDSFGCPRSRDAPIIVFLTVCTKDRKAILASWESHALLIDAWGAAKMWQVGTSLCLIIFIYFVRQPSQRPSLVTMVKYWKSSAARNWIKSADSPVWQRHFWDTQLRRSESYDQKWNYVVENPVRAGLVARSEDWSFQGELNELRW